MLFGFLNLKKIKLKFNGERKCKLIALQENIKLGSDKKIRT